MTRITGAIDYEGRRLLLNAFEKVHWPSRRAPLRSLEDEVLPLYKSFLDVLLAPDRLVTAIRSEWDDVKVEKLRQNKRPEAVAAYAALTEWAKTFGFTDEWIVEAAHRTTRYWCGPFGTNRRWKLPRPVLQPEPPAIAGWDPDTMKWGEYLRYVHSTIDHYLKHTYQPEVLAQTPQNKTSSATHARWTALYFAGRSFSEIAQSESEAIRGSSSRLVSRQAVQKAVRAFAARVRLSLTRVN